MTPKESKLLKRIIDVLKWRVRPQRIILFGSRATPRFAKGADFDIAVDGDKPPLRTEREIRETLEKHAGLYSLDIIYLNAVDKEFREHVLQTGKVLYEKTA